MNEMIHVGLLSKEKCCGCTACYSICTRGAISMKRDEQGFSYPEIDENLCTQCGLCVRTCPSLSPKFYKSIKCFGAKHILKDTISTDNYLCRKYREWTRTGKSDTFCCPKIE